jgi:hypothetical protein
MVQTVAMECHEVAYISGHVVFNRPRTIFGGTMNDLYNYVQSIRNDVDQLDAAIERMIKNFPAWKVIERELEFKTVDEGNTGYKVYAAIKKHLEI